MKNLLIASLVFFSINLAAQSPVSTAPFQLFGDHIFVQLSVDDSALLDFIFETGAGETNIDLDVARNLNLNMDHTESEVSAMGTITGSVIKHNKVEFADIEVQDLEVFATSLAHLEISIGRNIDGIIGWDLLKKYVIKLDYDKMMLELYDPSGFNGGEQFGKGVHFKPYSHIPHIEASITLNNNETIKGEYFVLSGAGTTLDFNTPFVNSNDIIGKTGDHYSYLVKGLEDDEVKHYEGKVKSFQFAGFEITNLPVGISQATSGIQANKKMAGIIGNELLRRFNVTLDYNNKMMYFKKNSHFDEAFHVNASGIDLQLSKDMKTVLVHQVYEDSPASNAGIEENAEVLTINGKSASSMTLPELEKIMNNAGDVVEVKVKQGGGEKTVSLELKDLI